MALRVNGELIEDDRFHREFLLLSGGRTPQQIEQHSPAEFQQMQYVAERNVLRSVLLRHLAAAENITVSAEEAERERRAFWGSGANESCGTGVTEDMATQALVRKVERHLTRHVPRPDRREVEAVYRTHQAAFAQPERWLVSHIVRLAESEAERVEAVAELTKATEELKRGKPFPAVAERYSDCRGNGGDLGWISRGVMVPEFEEHVFALQRKKVSGVFQTIFGLHIAVVQEHKAAGVPPLEDVRVELAKRIFEDRKENILNQAVDELVRQAAIEVVAVSAPERSIVAGEKAP